VLVTGGYRSLLRFWCGGQRGFELHRAAGLRVVAGRAGTKNKTAKDSRQRRVLCGPGRSGDASGLRLIKNKHP